MDDDGFGMMEESIQQSGGQGGVIVENGRPFLEYAVGGNDDGPLLISPADDLKEEIGEAEEIAKAALYEYGFIELRNL